MDIEQLDITKAEYNIGDVVYHHHYDFRGVIIDVDANFSGDDEWYDEEDGIKAPKDAPWYHVLVDEEATMAYVAEQSIRSDSSLDEVIHPMINDVFTRTSAGKYMPRQTIN
ncbi:MAG TPA: heat shock protein HspQ [Leucothrix mucor]|nr:heat shock protein HspQ [Leucothrix mucor]